MAKTIYALSFVIFQLLAITSSIGITLGNLQPPQQQVVDLIKTKTDFDNVKIHISGKWCVAKSETTNAQLQSNIDWVCSQGIDCKPISPGGACFDNNIKSRATFVMNAYYQSKTCADDACNFGGSGVVTTTNPSTSTCTVPSSIQTNNDKWCVAKSEATDEQLQSNIDWVCNHGGIDCKEATFFGPCLDKDNNNLKTKATFIMNAYYKSKGYAEEACDFSGSGIVTSSIGITLGNLQPPQQVVDFTKKKTDFDNVKIHISGKWCVAKSETTNAQLQSNIDWVCSQGIDCKPISPGGACFDNNIKSRATFIMNAYYQSKTCSDDACNFGGSGVVTTTNPSSSTCTVPSSIQTNNDKWCVAKSEATDEQLQSNIDWVCNHGGIDCKEATFFGPCLDKDNNNLKTKATFIMNAYYKSKGYAEEACDFSGSGIVNTNDPSTKTCRIPGGGVKGCGF